MGPPSVSVRWPLISRLVMSVTGLASLLFIASFLSPIYQGVYYTFAGLIALQVVADGGLNAALTNFAAHEKSMLHIADSRLSGDPAAKRRLQSLLNLTLIWFGIGGALLSLVFLVVGSHMFSDQLLGQLSVQELERIRRLWYVVSLIVPFNLLATSLLAILEGIGEIAMAAIIKTAQYALASLSGWLALSMGQDLAFVVIYNITFVLIGWGALALLYRRLFADLLSHRCDHPPLHWKKDVFPFQWRIAVSWLSGYFTLQIFSPLLLPNTGAVAAGQFGMTVQVLSAFNGLAILWITTRIPQFAAHIVRREREQLERLFMSVLVRSTVMWIVMLLLFALALVLLTIWYPSISARILPPLPLAVLAISFLANHLVFSQAIYLRAHKNEPFMVLSMAAALTTVTTALWWITPLGLWGAVLSHFVGSVVVALGGGTVIFLRLREKYGEQAAALT